MARRYWRVQYDLDFYGVYHEPPPLQPEEVNAIGEVGLSHPLRYMSNNLGGTRLAADLPHPYGGGLLMNHRATQGLLQLLTSLEVLTLNYENGGEA